MFLTLIRTALAITAPTIDKNRDQPHHTSRTDQATVPCCPICGCVGTTTDSKNPNKETENLTQQALPGLGFEGVAHNLATVRRFLLHIGNNALSRTGKNAFIPLQYHGGRQGAGEGGFNYLRKARECLLNRRRVGLPDNLRRFRRLSGLGIWRAG